MNEQMFLGVLDAERELRRIAHLWRRARHGEYGEYNDGSPEAATLLFADEINVANVMENAATLIRRLVTEPADTK